MPLTSADRELIQRCRAAFEQRYSADPRLGPATRLDRPDESTLISRFPVADRLWLEWQLRPFLPQFRAGIVTDDRWLSEELETAIEDSGDTMSEFVELGFEEVGLTWKNPTVEHYRDQGKYFYFATALELHALKDLDEPSVTRKTEQMIEGYYEAFRHKIERLKAAAK
jgi:hypothetical protein